MTNVSDRTVGPMALRWQRRASRVVSFGLRVGYWPCLKAPFIQLAGFHTRLEVWFGLPSYKKGEPL